MILTKEVGRLYGEAVSERGAIVFNEVTSVLKKADRWINKNINHSATNPEGQQHSGDNVKVYGKGSRYGSEIPASKPDPNGKNEYIDISKGLPGKSIMKSPVMNSAGLRRVNNILKGLDKTKSALSKPISIDTIEMGVDDRGRKYMNTVITTTEVKK